jgi:CyaY protein
MTDFDYEATAKKTLRALEDLFAEIDPDQVDCERAGDVITITFPGGLRCIVNTQRPTKQLWLAAKDRAWHFSYDGASWLDDKGRGEEFFATVKRIVHENAGISL